MTISPFDLILLLGSVQGAILATLLWINSKGNRLSNRLLAALIGSLTLMSFAVGVPITSQWVSLAIDLLPFFLAMSIGPLIYFYTRSVLDSGFRLGKEEKRHFYTTILDIGAPLIGWTFVIGSLLGFIPKNEGPRWGHIMDEYNTYVDIPRWLSATIYLVITKRFLNHYQASHQNQQQQQNVRWLGQFVSVFLIFQAIWFIHLVPYIVPAWRGPLLDRFGWYPIYIPIAVLIYWLGFKGYLHTRSESIPSANLPSKTTGSDLPVETVEQVVTALDKAMGQEKLYMDPDLSVDKLGQHLQLPPKLISAVLNQHIRKNFNGFINEYRVEEVKRRVLDPTNEHLTLTGIAFESGFNSQATFQRTFKQLTGSSPGEYMAQQKKKASQIGI
ncbi:helix-turn-helix domain-containing protein [Spirosoma aerolatum]|uniref:helix-turn-helix domain-containing protein n=1 Tax=Spirosoma aerolatum TaxID=1211326 RepID=UPI0009AC5E0A|nr:helix-turn-helix domain-containing protein [Spirosoma aerolatum]